MQWKRIIICTAVHFISVISFSQQHHSKLPVNENSKATQQKDTSVSKSSDSASVAILHSISSDSAFQSSKIDSLSNHATKLSDSLKADNKKIDSLQKKVVEISSKLKETFDWWLYISASITTLLLLIISFMYFKMRQMKKEEVSQKEIINYATKNIDELEEYFIRKKIINTTIKVISDSYIKTRLDLIRDKIKEFVEKYIIEDQNSMNLNEELSKLNDLYKNSLVENYRLTKELESSKQLTLQPASSLSQTVAGFPKNVILSEVKESYIKSFTMVSAGPRKEAINTDTELGEDVTGTLSLPGQTFFWLMDGTSDSAAIKNRDEESGQEPHIFSSRLLAQNFGNYIQNNIITCFQHTITLDQLVTEAKENILAGWEKSLNSDLSSERRNTILQLIKQGFKPLCSTTIIVGTLLTDGTLYVLRTGDSKVFPFIRENDGSIKLVQKFKFANDPTDENDRIAFRLDYDSSAEKFVIKSNHQKWSVQKVNHIFSVFVFSDGIGRIIEKHLASNNPGITEIIKDKIARISQKTYDDKSLIILERILNPQ